MTSPTENELKKLTEKIKKDQAKPRSAEERVKIKTTFEKAVKKMGQTPSLKRRME